MKEVITLLTCVKKTSTVSPVQDLSTCEKWSPSGLLFWVTDRKHDDVTRKHDDVTERVTFDLWDRKLLSLTVITKFFSVHLCVHVDVCATFKRNSLSVPESSWEPDRQTDNMTRPSTAVVTTETKIFTGNRNCWTWLVQSLNLWRSWVVCWTVCQSVLSLLTCWWWTLILLYCSRR